MAFPVEQSNCSRPAQAHRFMAHLADCDEARQLHFRIRHEVYCQRKGYEPAQIGNSGPIERDHHDEGALHFLLHDRWRGRWVGTARIIPGGHDGLPMEDMGALDPCWRRAVRAGRFAEVSRLASVATAAEGRSTTTALMQGMIAALSASSIERGIDHLVFLVAPPLARLLNTIEIPLTPCGPSVEHKGRRRAYVSDVAATTAGVDWLRERVEAGDGFRRYNPRTPNRREVAFSTVPLAAMAEPA